MLTYTTFWVYRKGAPVKRFIGADKYQQALDFALDQHNNHPECDIKIVEQKQSERTITVYEGRTQEKPKVFFQ